MKKLLFIIIVGLGVCSCNSSKETINSKKPLYYKQYQKGSITESEYQFLCKGESELFNIKYKVK